MTRTVRLNHVTGQSSPQFTLPFSWYSWPRGCTPLLGLLQGGDPAENSKDSRPSWIFLSSALGCLPASDGQNDYEGKEIELDSLLSPPTTGLLSFDFHGLGTQLVFLVAEVESRGVYGGVFSILDLPSVPCQSYPK